MITLITGGSGSGKSAYAEEEFSKLQHTGKKYYVATMKVYDEDGKRRVERHRKMRENRGFVTIEQPQDIEEAIGKMQGSQNAALLECMSNLVANEMYQDKIYPADEVVEKIIKGIEDLEKHLVHLMIVTNNVFEDGVLYDEMTMEYLHALDEVNIRLAKKAEKVIEVVVGIPVCWKGQEGKNEDH